MELMGTINHLACHLVYLGDPGTASFALARITPQKRTATERNLFGGGVSVLAKAHLRPMSQQAHPVQDDDERGAHIGEDGHPQRSQAGEGQRHNHRLDR